MLDAFSFYFGEYHFRGVARNFATEWLELPTGGFKMTEQLFFVRYFAKFHPMRSQISSDGGLDASDGGL